jgi:hypothetical protein
LDGDGGEIVVVVAMQTNDARLVVGVGARHGKREGLNGGAFPIGGRGDENELIFVADLALAEMDFATEEQRVLALSGL